jgi:acetylornithine deacetylase/succinyl-diaminopimelate desuccinylase-like protein
VLGNPAAAGPLLIAHRHEAGDLPTVLTYSHADVLPAETVEESGSPGFGEFCEQHSINWPSAC